MTVRRAQARADYSANSDVRNGLLVHVTTGDDPMSRLVLLLDDEMDLLMPGGDLYGDASALLERVRAQGRAKGLAMALWVISCYSEEQVRQQAKIRWQRRQEQGDGND